MQCDNLEIKERSMARGHQKFQSQQKNLKKQGELKKSKGSDQKAAAIKALTHKCSICMVKFPFKNLFSTVNKCDIGFWYGFFYIVVSSNFFRH